MKQQGILGLPTIPRKVSPCDACILGKHCKNPFYDSTSRALRKSGVKDSDLFGPMHVQSSNGNKYLLTFIDHCISMCLVYFLKEKSQVFPTFKSFHLWITNESQLNIETTNDLEKYLEKNGIKHQTTVPYNPQQNGVAELMNTIFLNMVRSMTFLRMRG